MKIYTVHAPLAAGTATGLAADRVAFVRDGFHAWAFLGGPFWLLYHRLWLATIGYVVLAIALMTGFALLRMSGGSAEFWTFVLLALLLGFEGSSLRRGTLQRRKWRQIDVVVAGSEEEAERRFFDRWAARQRDLLSDRQAVDRGAPPPTRDVPGQPFSRPPEQPGILGLFPQPGTSP